MWRRAVTGIVKSSGGDHGESDVVLGRAAFILKPLRRWYLKTRVVRGHHIFSQADSLAMALVDADAVLTRHCQY